MIPKAVNISAEVASKPVLKNRTPKTPDSDDGSTFAVLAKTENGGVYAGRFEGRSPWERHANGDELVQILDGNATVSVVVDGSRTDLEMSGGMMTIVPRGCWHRFDAPAGVTVMTMTPTPTEHIYAEELPSDLAG